MSERPDPSETARDERPDRNPEEPVEDLDVPESDSEHVKGGSVYQWWKKIEK
jgi:hypothetical protein